MQPKVSIHLNKLFKKSESLLEFSRKLKKLWERAFLVLKSVQMSVSHIKIGKRSSL